MSKRSDICRWVSWFAIIQSAIAICLSGSTTGRPNALSLGICSLGIIIWASNSNVVLVIRKCERKTSNSYTGTVTKVPMNSGNFSPHKQSYGREKYDVLFNFIFHRHFLFTTPKKLANNQQRQHIRHVCLFS